MKKLSNQGSSGGLFLKLLLRMKLTMLLVMIGLISFGSASYSQSSKLNISMKNRSLLDFIQEIEKQTDFYFFYQKEDISEMKNISIDESNASIKDILESVFTDSGYNYEIIDRYIVLRKAGKEFDFPSNSTQNKSISGIVTDENKEPLPGVAIMVKGTNSGTVTDFDGKFSLSNVSPTAVLVVSFVGMKMQELPVGAQSFLQIIMQVDAIGIEEVVAVGYGVQKKVNMTGAVDVITNEQIQNRQAATVSQILQGQAPGLSFSVDGNGFQPGANMSIDVRGVGSLNGSSPYILIDGIPGDMNRLNPDDIESVSVLKDAAASAIYGARAPYGVILITTKAGKRNQKITATYSGSVSINTPQRLPEMLDSYTFARVENEAGVNKGGRVFLNPIVDRIIAYQKQDWDYLKQFMPSDVTHYETVPKTNGYWADYKDAHANNDWFDIYYGNSVNQKHNFSFQGGQEKTGYYFSAGYLGQEGVLNYGKDTYDRYNVSGKINTALTSWWDFRYEPRFMKSKREIPNMDKQGGYELIFHQIARTIPTQPLYDGYGHTTIQSKIPWTNDAGTDQIETTENWHNFATEIRPAKGWKINGDFAYKSVDIFQSNQEFTVYEYKVDQSVVASGNTVPSNIKQIHHSNYYWTTNLYTSYDFNINNVHNFYVLAGTQFEYNVGRNMSVLKNNMMVPGVPSLETATEAPVASEELTHWATEGYFGRLTYNYKEKYLLEANARYDGTSRFKEGNRWGFFPSFSLGWNVNKENFWESISPYVNTFKVRGSWGQLGNQNVASYSDLELIPLQSGTLSWLFNYGSTKPIGYTTTPGLVSPSLTWETASTKNIGLNMSFLNGRLRTDFDWFERMTTEMIGPAEAKPGVMGASVPKLNNSTLRTRGWELNLSWKQDFKNGLSYHINANLYDDRSVVTKYLNPTGTLSTWYEGRETGEIWGYTANSLFQNSDEITEYRSKVDLSHIYGAWNPGDVKYEDINGDGKVNNGAYTIDDHGDLKIIGNSSPHYQWGLSAGVNFKGFDISMLWKGVMKADQWFGGSENFFWGFNTWNQSTLTPQMLDYFRDTPGDEYTGLHMGDDNINLNAYFPKPYLNSSENNKNRVTSTRYLQDASFVRLQNLQIGYSLPRSVISKANLQKVRIYFSGENLLTITDLFNGIDPVALKSSRGVGKTYGPDRIFSLGISVTY